MQIHVFNEEQEVLSKLAEYFVQTADEAIARHGRFSVVLSGGSSPKKLYELLASSMFSDKVEWHKVYFFFGDERYVPHTDPQSNYRMAKKTLFNPLHIAASHIFPMDTNADPIEAAEQYAQLIKNYFNGEEMRFDLVLLGLGDNSHTASLFPHTPVLHDKVPSAAAVYIEDPGIYRITLNAPLINLAHQIAFLVYGEAKALAVRHVIEGEHDIEHYPAQLISAEQDGLHWFLDAKAAQLLEKFK
jgi:6-phosphogluconolactonase